MPPDGGPNQGDPTEPKQPVTDRSLDGGQDLDATPSPDRPNQSGAKQSTTCELCDASFEYYPSEKKGLYCGECVENAAWRTLPDITGSNNPRWSGGKATRECAVCGDTVVRYPSGFSGSVTVCGEACRRQWLSEAFTGAGHPNWKGGGNEPYGQGWAEARRRALERDGYACCRCGRSESELGRNPDVHHIVPVRRFIDAETADRADAHVLRNLITLCSSCHRSADFGRPSKLELKRSIGAI
ncbi:MAG: HNH endonuclease [Halobacteriales archaeon]|nr:HNH endonuclease [Halobacteriales archaeon]